MTLEEIRDKKLGAVINTKTKNEALLLVKTLGVDKSRLYDETDFINVWDAFKENTCYRVVDGKVDMSDCVKYYQSIHEKIYEFSDLFATGGVVSIHDLPTSEWYNPHIDLIFDKVKAKELAEQIAQRLDKSMGISKTIKEEKNLKFTFYTNDWTDIDKSNGKKIPMRTTYAFTDEIKADTDCSVAEYDERIGCLIAAAKISAKKSSEAKIMYNIARNTWGTELSWAILFELANAACGGNFERIYKKFHNDNERFEKKRFTCTYCGKIFNTVEEKQAHEAWHVERKKARRERYLLRKRAKEIAFEEQAQKLAKAMTGEK